MVAALANQGRFPGFMRVRAQAKIHGSNLKGHVMASVGPRSNPSILKRALMGFTTEPVESLTRVVEKLHERYYARGGPVRSYEAVADWDQRLHEHLAIEWPCPTCTEFGELWERKRPVANQHWNAVRTHEFRAL